MRWYWYFNYFIDREIEVRDSYRVNKWWRYNLNLSNLIFNCVVML